MMRMHLDLKSRFLDPWLLSNRLLTQWWVKAEIERIAKPEQTVWQSDHHQLGDSADLCGRLANIERTDLPVPVGWPIYDRWDGRCAASGLYKWMGLECGGSAHHTPPCSYLKQNIKWLGLVGSAHHTPPRSLSTQPKHCSTPTWL